MNEWNFVDEKMPQEGEYILATSGEEGPIFITRLHDGDWDIPGGLNKRLCFTKTELFFTRAPVVFWMPLPEPPKLLGTPKHPPEFYVPYPGG